ncbi:L-seryl-tRNA(Sec) kinase [Stomoxys calcitrans]|uniref:L-seryl-tRNA(Sec) kinase n=1 Tax=Stomoxys calcitrans TaxID=35570 RepID=UPI0027E358CB|nr:L-seryl-tRNA(Sec) kinase [Stomoxys calcitrans]
MEQICIVALIGLPAAGKTSFSKLLLETENVPFSILHICFDNFLKCSDDNATSYRLQREEVLKFLADTIESLKNINELVANIPNLKYCSYRDCGSRQLLIVCDDNNYYASMRYKLFQIARKFCISYGQIYFECNLATTMERNASRDASVRIPENVFHKMVLNLECPDVQKNYWEENTFTLHTEDCLKQQFIFSNIIRFLNKLFDNPLKPTEANSKHAPTKQSLVHDLDLVMRKRIGSSVNAIAKCNKGRLAFELNNKRKEILKEFQDNTEDEVSDFHKYLGLFEESLEGIETTFLNL